MHLVQLIILICISLFYFLLKLRICIQSSAKVMYNFVNTNDVAQAVKLVMSRLHVSKNKIYIVSDDCRQNSIYEKNS